MPAERAWIGGLAEWIEGDTVCLSVAFTWLLPEARSRALFYRACGYRVRAGGPATFARRRYLEDVAEVGGSYPDAIARHNPAATMASRGCPVGCWFCIVPKMEGRDFTLLPDFPVRPVLCDNNLSGLPVEYQRHIIERYKAEGVPLLDAQSGFEPLTFDGACFERWRAINRGPWRFAYDELREREPVRAVMTMLAEVVPKRKRVYVLLGNEPVDACLGRLREVIEWGGEPHAHADAARSMTEEELHALHRRLHEAHAGPDIEVELDARWRGRGGQHRRRFHRHFIDISADGRRASLLLHEWTHALLDADSWRYRIAEDVSHGEVFVATEVALIGLHLSFKIAAKYAAIFAVHGVRALVGGERLRRILYPEARRAA